MMRSDTSDESTEYFFYFIESEIGSSSPTRLDLVQGTYTLGKLNDCDMIFPGTQFKMSRTHATITVGPDTISIVDISTLGTWVNGLALLKNAEFQLQVGDRINLGSEDTVLRVGAVADVSKLDTGQTQAFHEPTPEFKIDRDIRSVLIRGQASISLTPQEYTVLEYLWEQRGIVCEYGKIYSRMRPDEHDDLGGDGAIDPNAVVRNLVMGIRRKLKRSSILIRTVPTIGYTVPPLQFTDRPPFS